MISGSDNGQPGTDGDYFKIKLWDDGGGYSYENSGTLEGGNIKED